MKQPIYILPCAARAAGTSKEWLDQHGTALDTPVREWTAICHGGDMIYIQHLPRRDTSRWVTVDRKRPYLVKSWVKGRSGTYSREFGASKTLAGALKLAKEAA